MLIKPDHYYLQTDYIINLDGRFEPEKHRAFTLSSRSSNDYYKQDLFWSDGMELDRDEVESEFIGAIVWHMKDIIARRASRELIARVVSNTITAVNFVCIKGLWITPRKDDFNPVPYDEVCWKITFTINGREEFLNFTVFDKKNVQQETVPQELRDYLWQIYLTERRNA